MLTDIFVHFNTLSTKKFKTFDHIIYSHVYTLFSRFLSYRQKNDWLDHSSIQSLTKILIHPSILKGYTYQYLPNTFIQNHYTTLCHYATLYIIMPTYITCTKFQTINIKFYEKLVQMCMAMCKDVIHSLYKHLKVQNKMV